MQQLWYSYMYLRPGNQTPMHNAFVGSLPWNCFSHKNVGYLWYHAWCSRVLAIKRGGAVLHHSMNLIFFDVVILIS